MPGASGLEVKRPRRVGLCGVPTGFSTGHVDFVLVGGKKFPDGRIG